MHHMHHMYHIHMHHMHHMHHMPHMHTRPRWKSVKQALEPRSVCRWAAEPMGTAGVGMAVAMTAAQQGSAEAGAQGKNVQLYQQQNA